MKTKKVSDAALGIFISPNRIEAVLLRPKGEHAEVVGRFTRQRIRTGELIGSGTLAAVLPGLRGTEDSDFTIQIGDGACARGGLSRG